MIVVIHGDDEVKSRERFLALKAEYEKNGCELVNLDGKTAKAEEIGMRALTASLLGQSPAVFVEGFFARKKKIDKGTEALNGEVIFWEGKEISKTILSSLPKDWKIENFAIPNSLFKFLDSLAPGRMQTNVSSLHQVLASVTPEMLLPLLAWHTRQLIWAKEEPQTLALPTWKTQKLTSQASRFDIDALYALHDKVSTLDRDIKTGSAPLPLSSSLDLIVAAL